MTCQSGQHEWIDPIDASRCCSEDWRRVWVFRGEEDHLDAKGRTPAIFEDQVIVRGWIPAPPPDDRPVLMAWIH